MEKLPHNFNATESWEISRTYSGLIGQIPSSFYTTIRALVTDDEKLNGQLSAPTRQMLSRLTKSPSMRAAFFFATYTCREEVIKANRAISTEQMTSLYRAADAAAVLAVIYAYRRLKKLSDPEEWKFLSVNFQRDVDIGMLVGIAIPAIGLAIGLLAGASQAIGHGCFHLHDKKGFQTYRRHLKSKNIGADLAFEIERWGCAAVQVSASVLQAAGFGIPLTHAFAYAVIGSTNDDPAAADRIKRFEATLAWIDAFGRTGRTPQGLAAKFHPDEAAEDILLHETGIIRSKGSKGNWLDRGKGDLSAELTPTLYVESGFAKGGTIAVPAGTAASDAGSGAAGSTEEDVIEEIE